MNQLTVVNKRSTSSKITEAGLALKLYDLGFNVVPVDVDKKPLCSWSSSKRISREKLEELLNSATGIAIVGGTENPWKPVAILVIIDIDKPSILSKSPLLKSIVESTVSWKTGPRCPQCEEKHLDVLKTGKLFKCPKCNIEFTVEKAKRGLATLITLDRDVYEKYLSSTRRFGDVEFLVNNYALVPPSIHRTGVAYEWIRPFKFEEPDLGVKALIELELKSLLEELSTREETKTEETRAGEAKLRELSDSDILKLKELLKDAYKPGVRQYIWLYLSGWGAKAKISPISIAKLLKMLYEETGDTDSIKSRASAIVYSYKKLGVDVDSYAEEFEKIFGVKPYGLEKEVSEEEVKGKTGLQEVLEDVLGEERALSIIKEIEDVFGVASPFRDSIIEILDYEKQLYAVANLRKLVVVRARRDRDKMIYKERVTVGAPTSVTVYVNPIGGVTKYEVVWEAATRPKPLVFGPALLEEVVDRLRAEGLVLSSRLVSDVLAAVIEGFIRKGKALIKTEIESPGFYLIDNKLVVVKVDVREPSKEELREALELLNELAEVWYKHVIARFSTAIKWGIVAPFSYCYKQKGKWIPWMYLYGTPNAGKTSLGEIILKMWGLDSEHIRPGSSIDSPARLGYVVSKSTFPVVIIEPGGALSREDVVEMVKSSIEKPIARGKYVKGSYIDIPALAPLFFTSNTYAPRDDALLRRLIVFYYSYGERIPVEKVREYERSVKPRLSKLQSIGRFVASYVISRYPDGSFPEDPWELAKAVLEEAYRVAGLEPPSWLSVDARGESVEDVYEDMVERIRSYIVERVNDEYSKFVGKLVVEKPEEGRILSLPKTETSLKERAVVVLEKGLLPWAILRNNTIYITSSIVEELRERVGDISLKSLAELLKWRYIPKKSFKVGKAVTTKTVIEVPLEDFLAFIGEYEPS